MTGGTQDVWEDWKPAWEGAAPHALQETHSPTCRAGRKAGREVNPPPARRRLADARLWESLLPQHQDAALEIALAFESIGRGLGYTTSDWERIPGGGPLAAADSHARLVGCYVAWAARCRQARVSHSLVVDVLVYGFSCRAIDRDRGAGRGFARRNLVAGLDIYCALRGWPCTRRGGILRP